MAETGEDRGSSKGGVTFEIPSLEEVQHWTGVMGQAQQMLMEQVAESIVKMPAGATMPSIIGPVFADPTKLADQQSER